MAEKREEQMKEITERLEQGVQELFTSEQYKKYLKTMSQFHNYSFNNTLLIAMQKPDATLVAGYGAWQKNFNRQVKRGEKGIKIIAPVMVRKKEELEKFDSETNEPILRPDGQPETEEVEHIITRFRVATVFDISQTEGEPLPELDTPELIGSVENFEIFMRAIKRVSPAPIRYAEIEGNTKGYYDNGDKEIVIQEGMSESQTMETGIHEVTHAICHDRELMEEAGEKKNQMTKEVEAESVAYTVCSYFGLDTSDYSFPYIAGWSSDMEMNELHSSMDFIRKTAGSFIDRMLENIQELQKEQSAKEHLEENDLMLKVTSPFAEKDTYFIVENMKKKELLAQLESYHNLYSRGDELTVEDFLDGQRARLTLWYDSTGFAVEKPVDFFDVEYDYETGVTDSETLPVMEQADMLMKREEYSMKLFDESDREIIRNHAYKMDNIKTLKVYIQDLALAKWNTFYFPEEDIREFMQSDIDGLPDKNIGLKEMHEFGYHNDSVLPLKMERAIALHNAGLHIYSLQKDGDLILMNTEEDIWEAGGDGLFGVDAKAWESYQEMESAHEENAEKEQLKEDLFFSSRQDCYAIYQIKDDGQGRKYLFMSTEYLKNQGFSVEYDDYQMVYGDELGENETLDSLYEKFNVRRPLDFKGHSLSVSDVVALKQNGKISAHYVDSFGYTELPEFFHQKERIIEQEKGAGLQENSLQKPQNEYTEKQYGEVYPPLYTHTISYAMEHRRVDDYLDSRSLNLKCKEAIENAIRKNFDGMHLAHDAAEGVLEEYGAERVVFILANTVQHLEHDGRFSIGNKAWAKGYEIPENVNQGMDMNADYVVNSHPATLDGFILLAREEMREQELGKEETVWINAGTKGFIANGHFGTWHTVEAKEIRGELFYRMEHEEYGDSVASIIVNQEGELVAEDLEHGFDAGAMEAIGEYFSEKGLQIEPEPSFIAQYYVMQKAEGGKTEREYQYFSDVDAAVTAYHQIPNHLDKSLVMESTEQPPSRMSLIECRNGIETLTDIEKYSPNGKWVREETMKASQKAKEYLDNCDSEIAYQIGKGYFSIQTVSDGYDYTIYGKDFREIDGGVYDNPDITIGEAMEAILSDEGIQVVACKVMNHEELHERVEAAQETLQKAQTEEKGKLPLISDMTEPDATITFYVTECTEFPVLGEYHERLETLQEAMELYEKIPAERMNGIKGIGFCLEDGSIYDGNFDLMVMGEMQTEFINEIPQYRQSHLVQKAIADMEEILANQKVKDMPELEKGQESQPSLISSENKKQDVQVNKSERIYTATHESGGDIARTETKATGPVKSVKNAPKVDRGISGGSKKQSVLNALRERQARIKAQKQGQKAQEKKKGEQEL